MMVKKTIVALAAVPAVLLAGGGVAVAQAAGAPAGTAVVQQAGVHHGGGVCRGDQAGPVMTIAAHQVRGHQNCDGTRNRDRDRVACQQAAGTGTGMMTRAHHGDGCGDG